MPSNNVAFSSPITRGDPRHMKGIGIFIARKRFPGILQISAMDRQGAEDLEALQALVESIKHIKIQSP